MNEKLNSAGDPLNTIVLSEHRTDEFFKTARAMSDYLKDLPLDKDQNDRLVHLMVAHAVAAERSGAVCMTDAFFDVIEMMAADTGGVAN